MLLLLLLVSIHIWLYSSFSPVIHTHTHTHTDLEAATKTLCCLCYYYNFYHIVRKCVCVCVLGCTVIYKYIHCILQDIESRKHTHEEHEKLKKRLFPDVTTKKILLSRVGVWKNAILSFFRRKVKKNDDRTMKNLIRKLWCVSSRTRAYFQCMSKMYWKSTFVCGQFLNIVSISIYFCIFYSKLQFVI